MEEIDPRQEQRSREQLPRGQGENKERPIGVAVVAEICKLPDRHSNMPVIVKYFASLREHHSAD
ncbi:MAG: hypothetical protein V3R72_11420, partial [Gammaproteobacteria bacterium]